MFIAARSLFGCFIKLWWSRGICKHIFPYSDHYTQETDKVCLKKSIFYHGWYVKLISTHDIAQYNGMKNNKKKGNHHQNRYCIFQKLIFPIHKYFSSKRPEMISTSWWAWRDVRRWPADIQWRWHPCFCTVQCWRPRLLMTRSGRSPPVCVCIFIYWGGVSQLWSCDTWDVPKLNRAVTWLRRYRRCAVPLQRVLYQNKSTHVTGGQSSR